MLMCDACERKIDVENYCLVTMNDCQDERRSFEVCKTCEERLYKVLLEQPTAGEAGKVSEI